jgi:hypothetical protein
VPLSYEIESNVVSSLADGIVTDEEVRKFGDDLLSDTRLTAGFRHLADLTQVEKSEASGETIAFAVQLSRSHAALLSGSHLAIVAPRTASFGLSRMFQFRLDGKLSIEVGVFRDRAEATLWLELDKPA